MPSCERLPVDLNTINTLFKKFDDCLPPRVYIDKLEKHDRVRRHKTEKGKTASNASIMLGDPKIYSHVLSILT